jgi:hypothetical protein
LGMGWILKETSVVLGSDQGNQPCLSLCRHSSSPPYPSHGMADQLSIILHAERASEAVRAAAAAAGGGANHWWWWWWR